MTRLVLQREWTIYWLCVMVLAGGERRIIRGARRWLSWLDYDQTRIEAVASLRPPDANVEKVLSGYRSERSKPPTSVCGICARAFKIES